jgi:hypothetical protein
MFYLTDSPQRAKLLKATRQHFQSRGWEVEDQSHPQLDFRVRKRQLRLFLRCLDGSARLYASSVAIIRDIENATRQVRTRTGGSLVNVFDPSFQNLALDTLILREVFAVFVENLHVITDLDRYLDELPGELDPRQSFLLKRDAWFCLFVAERYRGLGDDIRAIEWARYGVEASIGFSEAYMTLFTLLRDSGDLDGAEKIAVAALVLQPFESSLLRAMKDLSTRRGDPEAAARWALRLERELAVPRDFADIVKNQKLKAPRPSPALEQERREPEINPLGRIIAGLFRPASKD